MYQKGRAWIELNLNNLAHNAAQLKRLLPDSCALMPAVKANAYGHGADTIARALERMGVTDFCVASVGEGIALRNAGITGQILVLSYTSPYQFSELRRYRLTQTVIDYDYARQLHAFGKPIAVHVGIDTGMHRLGERFDHPEKLLEIWKFKNLNITGVFSHLCAADGTSKAEKEYTKKQIQAFNHSISFLKQNGCSGFKTHIQSSYGVLNYPSLEYDFARVGIALYGCFCTPHDQTAADVTLRPVLSLKSRIECVKQLHAGESVGYGMSYRRHSPGTFRTRIPSDPGSQSPHDRQDLHGSAVCRRIPYSVRICRRRGRTDRNKRKRNADGRRSGRMCRNNFQ